MIDILAGSTSQSVNIFLRDSSSTTGAGLIGLAYNTASLTAYYTFTGANATATSITLATLAAVNSAYSSGGFKEIDSTNMPGWYRFDIPNAALATSKGREVSIHFKGAANLAPYPIKIQLTGWDNQDGVRGGLTALPNAAAGANTGLPVVGTQVPNATAGASGGLLISGSNSGTTTFAAFTCTGSFTISDGLLVSRSTSNASAITATGNGTGSGAVFTSGSGATGDGVQMTAASTNGNGLANTGAGTGAGHIVTGGGTGNGFKAVGGGTSGDAILTSATSGHGATFAGTGTTKHGINATGGATTSDGIRATGGGTGHGLNLQSGSGATGNGLNAVSNATNGSGATLTSTGTGKDFNATSTPLTLAKTTNITGFNDIAATAIVSSGAITTSGGAVSTVTTVTNQLTAAQIATGVWQDTTAGDFTVASSIGKSLYTTGNAPGAASGLALVGSNVGTATSVSGSVGSVTGNVGGNVVGSVGSISGVTFPTNFSSLGISVAGKINGVVLTDTVTTYTGNTPQTGDSYARIGATGSGLTSLAPASTALSTAVWTTGLAGLLEPLGLAYDAGTLVCDLNGSVSGDVGGKVLGGGTGTITGTGVQSQLSSSERNGIATALLDLANGVETSVTVRQALRGISAMLFGNATGAQTGSELFKAAGNSGTTRVTNAGDSSGNRTVTLNL